MSFLDSTQPISIENFPDGVMASGPPATFSEAFQASYSNQRMLSASDSHAYARKHALEEMVDQIDAQRAPGTPKLNPIGTETFDPDPARVFDIVKKARVTNRDAFPGLPDSQEKFDAWMLDRVRANAADQAEILGRSVDTSASVGSFLGGIAAGARDPVSIMLSPFGAAAGQGLLRTIAIEGALGAAGYAASAPAISAWRQQVGMDYTADEFWDGLGFAAGGSALLGGAFKAVPALAHAVAGVPKTARGVIDGYRASKFRTPTGDAAANLAQAAEDTAASNPFAGTALGDEEHLARYGQAIRQAADPSAPDLGEPLSPPVTDLAGLPQPAGRRTFRPDELNVDAERFQFKSDGDTQGVNDALKGVTEWNPVLAGDVMVWEDTGGTKWVADGHQRSALARRLQKSGTQDIKLDGVLFREADGVTADDARLYAAVKNVVQGTGSEVDAAKVVRAAPQLFAHPSVPKTRALMRASLDLAKLDDDAFAMVANGIVPPEYGAMVGRLAPDPKSHAALIKLLSDAAPGNEVQIEAIVRDALETGVTIEHQHDLFGERSMAHLAFRDRARVLDATLKSMRRDKRVFGLLTNEANRIRGAGNVLADTANASRAGNADVALEALMKLANRKGPLADALNQAAQRVRREGLQAPVRDFVGSVQRAIDDGLLHGTEPRASGSAVDFGQEAPQRNGGSQDNADAKLAGFANPGHGEAELQAQTLTADAKVAANENDHVPLDPLTGDGHSTKDLLAELDASEAGIADLRACVEGGA